MPHEAFSHLFRRIIETAPAGAFQAPIALVLDDETALDGRPPEGRGQAASTANTVYVTAKLIESDHERQVGVLAHELAHVSLLQRGKEDHTEREADALAKSFWGHTIRYDEEDVQTIGPGTHPRPAHLDSRGSTRKSTRTRRNPQYDRLAWKIAVGASQRMTSGRVDAHDALVEEWKPYEDQDLHRELFRHARDILGKHSVDQLYAGLAARKSTLDDDIEEQAERAAWQEAHEEGRTRYNPSEAALSKPCPTCGALVGDPCRQVGPGGGQGGRPQSAEKLGIAMVSIHAARKRALVAWQEAHEEPVRGWRHRARYKPRAWQRGDVMKIGKTQWILQRAEPGAASFWAYKWPSKKNKSYAILCFDDVCTVHEIGGSAQRVGEDIASGPPVFVSHLEEGSW